MERVTVRSRSRPASARSRRTRTPSRFRVPAPCSPVRPRSVVGGVRRRQCVARSPGSGRRDQPGLRGRRQRGCRVRERLRRALQPWLRRGRRRQLDDPVRPRCRHGLAGDGALGVDRPGTLLPRLARVDRRRRSCRCPSSDAAGTTNLAASGGKVALVRGAAALTCGAAAGSCSSSSLLADLVGYGSAADFEGKAPARRLSTARRRPFAPAAAAPTPTRAPPTSPRSARAAQLGLGVPSSAPGAPAQGDDGGKGVGVNLDVQPVLSISLDQSTLNFGKVAPGSTPAPLAEHVTVVSNDPAGYSLKVHRSAFAPGDLPLAISATAPGKATLGPALAGGVLAPIPVAPAADLLLGTAAAAGAGSGDVWPARLGFAVGAARRGRRAAHGHRHVHGDRPVRLRPALGSVAATAVLAFGPAAGPLLGAVAGAGPAASLSASPSRVRVAAGGQQHAAGDERRCACRGRHGRPGGLRARPSRPAADRPERRRRRLGALARRPAAAVQAGSGRDRSAHDRDCTAATRRTGRPRRAHRPRDASGRRRARRRRAPTRSGRRRPCARCRGAPALARPHAGSALRRARPRLWRSSWRTRATCPSCSDPVASKLTLRRRGRLLAVLRSQGQELLPHTMGVVDFPLPRQGARAWLTAVVELAAGGGRRAGLSAVSRFGSRRSRSGRLPAGRFRSDKRAANALPFAA